MTNSSVATDPEVTGLMPQETDALTSNGNPTVTFVNGKSEGTGGRKEVTQKGMVKWTTYRYYIHLVHILAQKKGYH